MFFIDWLYKLLYGKDAANDLNESRKKPTTKRRK
jgi:hypothetical protein